MSLNLAFFWQSPGQSLGATLPTKALEDWQGWKASLPAGLSLNKAVPPTHPALAGGVSEQTPGRQGKGCLHPGSVGGEGISLEER